MNAERVWNFPPTVMYPKEQYRMQRSSILDLTNNQVTPVDTLFL
jgi:hypothetical protein